MKILFLSVILSGNILAQTDLTLFFKPADRPLNWSSPKEFLISGARNWWSDSRNFFGQGYVELRCGSETDLSSVKAKNLDLMARLILGSQGLGILFQSFEGEVVSGPELRAELDQLQKERKLVFIRYILSENQCLKAQQYLKDFHHHNVGRHYGLVHRPLYGEGVQPGSYAASFLDVLGFLGPEERENWQGHVHIPLELQGLPIKEQSVFFLKMFKDEWPKETPETKTALFWDADKIVQWIRKKSSSGELIIDKHEWPLPLESPWKRD